MGCRCAERRVQIGTAMRDIKAGDLATAASRLLDASRTLGEDAARFAQQSNARLAAAHARLRRV